MSSLLEHAKTELRKAGYSDEELARDGYGGDDPSTGWNNLTVNAVMELLEKFVEQGHSGASAPVCVQLFSKLALFKPLTPLTGEDDEWTQVTEDLWQNRRASRVFKGPGGQAYDIEGKIFREPSGTCFLSRESHVDVTFPYTPVSEYIDVPTDES